MLSLVIEPFGTIEFEYEENLRNCLLTDHIDSVNDLYMYTN